MAGPRRAASRLAALDVVCHGILADPKLADLLDGAEERRAELDPWQQANLGEMRRLWIHATALAPDLVEALGQVGRPLRELWRKARPASDFALVRPELETSARPGARGCGGQGGQARLRTL